MTPLPITVTDEELILFIDRWAKLLEQEDYEAAFNFTEHDDNSGWDIELIQNVIQSYDQTHPNPDQHVTVEGSATGRPQRKEVDRWPEANPYGYIGEIWYDLNINGEVSDLTATFALKQTTKGIIVELSDIHVM